MVCIPVSFEQSQVEARSTRDLPKEWNARPYTVASQRIGDAWVRENQSLVLKVPSVVVPPEHNYLINPRHPDADTLIIGDPEPLDADPLLTEDE